MRSPSPTDFTVPLPGVGDFVFARPKIRDLIAIDKEFEKVADGSDVVRVNILASVIALSRVTMVSCPPGWEKIDELDGDLDAQIGNLLVEYRKLEDSFRQAAKTDGAE